MRASGTAPFGIAPVVLVALDLRLHVGRRHDSNFVPKVLKHASPVMRTTARFHSHDRRRQQREKLLHLPTLQLTPQYNFTCGINPVNLEYVLSFCNGPRCVNPFASSTSPESCFCTGSAHGRRQMGSEEDKADRSKSHGRNATAKNAV
jgi:hypothetical protein